jgi:hypothetical protein
MLRDMEERHFWYRGRHRFLLHAVHRELGRTGCEAGSLRLIDLGGGCGGWLRYLLAHRRFSVAETALGDSSTTALEHAHERLPGDVGLYHLDLLNLGWHERWDLAFLLDVLGIPETAGAVRCIDPCAQVSVSPSRRWTSSGPGTTRRPGINGATPRAQ